MYSSSIQTIVPTLSEVTLKHPHRLADIFRHPKAQEVEPESILHHLSVLNVLLQLMSDIDKMMSTSSTSSTISTSHNNIYGIPSSFITCLVAAEAQNPTIDGFVEDLLATQNSMLRSFRVHIQTGDPPSAVAALRVISLLLAFPVGYINGSSEEENNNNNNENIATLHHHCPRYDERTTYITEALSSLHELVLTFGSSTTGDGREVLEGEFIDELIGIVKTEDPILSPPAVAIFHAIALGPRRIRASIVFTEIGGNPFIHLLKRLYTNEVYRSCSVELLNCMLSTREGITLCQTNSEIIDELVCETKVLHGNWNAVKNTKL